MDNSGLSISNEAVAAIFGSGGFLLALLTAYLSNRKSNGGKCVFHQDLVAKNESDHAEVFRRVSELERRQAAEGAMVDGLKEQLTRIEDMVGILLRAKGAS